MQYVLPPLKIVVQSVQLQAIRYVAPLIGYCFPNPLQVQVQQTLVPIMLLVQF